MGEDMKFPGEFYTLASAAKELNKTEDEILSDAQARKISLSLYVEGYLVDGKHFLNGPNNKWVNHRLCRWTPKV